MTVLDDINEDNFTHQSSSELIDHEYYESDTSSDNSKGEVDITPIDLKNKTTYIFHNHDVNVVHNYYAHLLS